MHAARLATSTSTPGSTLPLRRLAFLARLSTQNQCSVAGSGLLRRRDVERRGNRVSRRGFEQEQVADLVAPSVDRHRAVHPPVPGKGAQGTTCAHKVLLFAQTGYASPADLVT